jgi:hypothetical protein
VEGDGTWEFIATTDVLARIEQHVNTGKKR